MRAGTDEYSVSTQYFVWLYGQVCPLTDIDSPRSYTRVCELMHAETFKVIVKRDDNRVAEGAELRREFLADIRTVEPLEEADLVFPDATIFEVLVALCKRMDFMIDLPPYDGFFMLLQNLKLAAFTDEFCKQTTDARILRILRKFNDRAYEPTGKGGLFPLAHTSRDQRDVELWYQMGEYMTEQGMY